MHTQKIKNMSTNQQLNIYSPLSINDTINEIEIHRPN